MIASAFLLAAALAASPASGPGVPEAQPAPFELTDDIVYRLGGGSLMLVRAVEERVFRDPEAVAQFRRIGVDSACSIYNESLAAVLAEREPGFRSVLVSAIRHRVPTDVLMARNNYGWESVPMIGYRRRIMMEVEPKADPILQGAAGDVRAAFLRSARAASAVDPARASGSFPGWDFERLLARRMACMLLKGAPESFAARKQAFDGWYRTRDVR